ncbi:MAG: anti-sigma factor family protein [Hyphomicrobiales bacterium]
MRCDEVQERLSAFLDDEIDPATSVGIERHLDGCEECATMLARMSDLGQRLRSDVPYFAAPESLRRRVTRLSPVRSRHDAPRGGGWLFPVGGWVGAAAAVVAVLAGTFLFGAVQRQQGLASIEREVVSSHIRSLMASHLTDIASTDQHTVKPWFNGKLDFSPPVTDLAASGYPLIGGRLDYLDGRPVAALVYQRRKHWINVFIRPERNAGDSRSAPRTRQGYHVIRATHDGMVYWIVSDLSTGELSDFAQRLIGA